MDIKNETLPGIVPGLVWPEGLSGLARIIRAEPRRLKFFRVMKDWSQAEAAEWLGVSTRTWNSWENEKHKMPGRRALTVAKELQSHVCQ